MTEVTVTKRRAVHAQGGLIILSFEYASSSNGKTLTLAGSSSPIVQDDTEGITTVLAVLDAKADGSQPTTVATASGLVVTVNDSASVACIVIGR